MDYADYEGLHRLIGAELANRYRAAAWNVTYLEELEEVSYVNYMAQLRDVVSHIMHIYECHDPLCEQGKETVLKQLDEAKVHLDQLCSDTFWKILRVLRTRIREMLPKVESIATDMLIAKNAASKRILSPGQSFDEKCRDFAALIEILENVIKEHGVM